MVAVEKNKQNNFCAVFVGHRNRNTLGKMPSQATDNRVYPFIPSHQTKKHLYGAFLFGGDSRGRTGDLLNAIQALYQLSYTPVAISFYNITAFFSTVLKVKIKNF